MTYVDNIFPIVRRVGNYVARILNGELPAAMPIEYPAKFELVINLKTARDHGIRISPSVLSRATRVIE
jgi:putative ABC transport system substrate-binding protein